MVSPVARSCIPVCPDWHATCLQGRRDRHWHAPCISKSRAKFRSGGRRLDARRVAASCARPRAHYFSLWHGWCILRPTTVGMHRVCQTTVKAPNVVLIRCNTLNGVLKVLVWRTMAGVAMAYVAYCLAKWHYGIVAGRMHLTLLRPR